MRTFSAYAMWTAWGARAFSLNDKGWQTLASFTPLNSGAAGVAAFCRLPQPLKTGADVLFRLGNFGRLVIRHEHLLPLYTKASLSRKAASGESSDILETGSRRVP